MTEHVVINSDRTVIVPDSVKRIGNQYDHNVNKVIFDCPRYADSDKTIDMLEMKIFINYMRPDHSVDCSIAENITIDETDDSMIHFVWRISKHVTSQPGVLSTLVCVKQTDTEGNELYHWNTDLFQKFIVGNGMECGESIVEEHPEVITAILARLDSAPTKLSEFENDLYSEENKIPYSCIDLSEIEARIDDMNGEVV